MSAPALAASASAVPASAPATPSTSSDPTEPPPLAAQPTAPEPRAHASEATPPGSPDTDDDLDALRREAEAAAEAPAPTTAAPSATVFTSGQRSRQAANPELSVISDVGGRLVGTDYDLNNLDDASGFYFRVVGLHIEADLDPHSFFKAAIEVHTDGVEFGEAYGTWVAILPRVNLTVGKFRQLFGVVNRWHAPPMDQFDRPLALTSLLGEDGLNAIGASLDVGLPPVLWSSHTLTLQVTDPMNDTLFTGQLVGVPTGLAHLRNFWDLSDSMYLELGLTGVTGVNDDAYRMTAAGGLDLTLSWRPLSREEYQGVTWRSELYAVHKTLAGDNLQALGGYSYVNVKLGQTLDVGLRGDLTQTLALGNDGQWTWQVVPYVTWWQSKWVRLRLQANHLQPPGEPAQDTLTLQVVMAVGPHKHDLY